MTQVAGWLFFVITFVIYFDGKFFYDKRFQQISTETSMSSMQSEVPILFILVSFITRYFLLLKFVQACCFALLSKVHKLRIIYIYIFTERCPLFRRKCRVLHDPLWNCKELVTNADILVQRL